MYLLCCKGQSLRYFPGWGNPCHCGIALYVGEESEREQFCLLSCVPAFSHFHHYPQANWVLLVLLVLIHGWVSLCTFYALVSPSNGLSYETGSFSWGCNPLIFLQPEVFRLYFPVLGPWVTQSVSLPNCSSQFTYMQIWYRPVCQLPLCHVCSLLRLPISALLPVWMNVSPLTPWLSDFHTVQFSGISGSFLFLNWLLSFLLLWEEAKYIYLCLYLGQKSTFIFWIL